MPSIQILSDLHLENPNAYDVFEIIPAAPHLALIGDIGVVKDGEYFSFLERQLSHFETVFLILGNHEPYYSNWETAKEKAKLFEEEMRIKNQNRSEKLGSFIFMDQTRYDLSPTITILGCTLFSRIPQSKMEDISFGLNDFYHINDWTVEKHDQGCVAELEWLNTQVKSLADREPNRHIIILTHYSPTTASEATDPIHGGSKISSGFATDLSGEICWMNANVKVWAFGHTHFNCDFVDEYGKRVVSNQRGYYFQQSGGFDGSQCIELGSEGS